MKFSMLIHPNEMNEPTWVVYGVPVCLVAIHSTQTHVRYTVTHFANIHQRRA